MGISLLLASAVSGCISHVFAHPLDTIRTRLMVSKSHTDSFASVSSHLLRTDGARGLYRGFAVSLVMQAPAVATFLTSYEMSKTHLCAHTPLRADSPLLHLASGLVAETISAVFWTPMEVLKQRAQLRSGPLCAASASAIARHLLRHEGPRALYKGYGVTLAVFAPYSMIYFASYERFKSAVPQAWSGSATVGVCAASAGVIAAAATTPLDVIKTRLQTQDDLAFSRPHGTRPVHRTTYQIARAMALHEGMSSFFKGVSARVLWIIPGTSITMSIYEYLKDRFNLTP